ncbi:PREDICTED: uncharacterized protein LOC106338042 [Brassica oleracea var. oleracea]|uniref:uncharacterized protein LOC106338042 n=1 Tax=Brassica oleracea var. oleracea TaxID=109376 RepID=UPI0006A6EC55|nr:PREDICTED: uncharacterized protein LOC106338042 [Brassica oleracea var. oleracea]
MDAAEVKSRDYPPRLYLEGSSNLEGHLPHVRETIGLDVWEELVNSPIGVVARLAGRESMLNTGPLPTEKFDLDHYKEFWEELKVPLGMGPKLDELKAALEFCPLWSFEKRKWLGLLLLQALGVYLSHHNSRIPFQSAIRVFDDEAMRSYPWGRTAYEVLIDSIKTLAPEGGSYTISGMKDLLLIWAYESVACFGESFGRVRVRRMVLKDSIEEMFPRWPGEADDPQLGNAKGKGNEKKKKMKGGVSSEAEPPTKKQKKIKTQNEVNTIESEAAAVGKGSSEKEGSKDLELENKTTLTTIVSTLENISRKFDQIDSRFDAYELDRNRPLMDQRTIDDRVKALVEKRLKVLGVGEIPENNDNVSPPSPDKSLSLASPRVQTQQKFVNSPALAATPGKVLGPKKNLAKELDKESGVKRTLAEEFGSVAKATDSDLDFVVVSPSKAIEDDKDAKVPAYGRGCRGRRNVKYEDAAENKKAVQAEAALKRKEKADAKRKEAVLKKQKLAELKN